MMFLSCIRVYTRLANSVEKLEDLPLIKILRRHEAVMNLQINLGRFWKLNFQFILSANIYWISIIWSATVSRDVINLTGRPVPRSALYLVFITCCLRTFHHNFISSIFWGVDVISLSYFGVRKFLDQLVGNLIDLIFDIEMTLNISIFRLTQ